MNESKTTHRDTVAIELAALEERLRDDCQALLLDAVDAADAVKRVRSEIRHIEVGLAELAGKDVERFAELLESSGANLLVAVLNSALA